MSTMGTLWNCLRLTGPNASWFAQNPFNGPASQAPRNDHTVWPAEAPGPFRHRECFALKSQTLVVPRVAHLLTARGPATIFRAIGTIVVDAVQRQAFWPWPHIAQEGREVIAPYIGHDDAAPAVIRKRTIAWIRATVFSRRPGAMFNRARQAVRRGRQFRAFEPQAATTLGQIALEIGTIDIAHSAAVTAGLPMASIRSPKIAFHDQTPETLPRQIENETHAAETSTERRGITT